jgi:hypothetical protein
MKICSRLAHVALLSFVCDLHRRSNVHALQRNNEKFIRPNPRRAERNAKLLALNLEFAPQWLLWRRSEQWMAAKEAAFETARDMLRSCNRFSRALTSQLNAASVLTSPQNRKATSGTSASDSSASDTSASIGRLRNGPFSP